MAEFSRKHSAAVDAVIDPPVLPEGTQVISREGWYQFVNLGFKDASANEVVKSNLADSEVDCRVEEAFAIYRQHQLPFKWAIGPMSSPASLERKIAPIAETTWEFRGMAIHSDAPLSSSDEVRAEIVTSKNFEKFLEVNLAGWDLSSFSEQTRRRLEKMVKHPRYRCFLAMKGEQAVGSASTVLNSDHGVLIGAVVLDSFRGSGVYKKLIQARLSDLLSLGKGFAVTQARATTSAPILSGIGFETVYDARIYRFDGT